MTDKIKFDENIRCSHFDRGVHSKITCVCMKLDNRHKPHGENGNH